MPEVEAVKGRCVGCGFLSAWIATDNAHVEVGRHCRETGETIGKLNADGPTVFQCVVGAFDLQADLTEAVRVNQDNRRRAVLVMIGQDRKCDKFTPHVTGFSPKEHVQMVLSEQLVKAQEARLAEEKKANKERMEEEKKANEERRKEDARIAERRWKLGLIIGAVQAVGVAILAAILVVLAEPWKERAKQSVQPAAIPTVGDPGK